MNLDVFLVAESSMRMIIDQSALVLRQILTLEYATILPRTVSALGGGSTALKAVIETAPTNKKSFINDRIR